MHVSILLITWLVAIVQATQYERLRLPKLINSEASADEKALLTQIYKFYPDLEKIDDLKSNLEFDLQSAGSLDLKEFKLLQEAIGEIRLSHKWSGLDSQDDLIAEWQYTFDALGELYIRLGRLLMTGDHPGIFDNDLASLSRFEQAYFYVHTAAAFNNKLGRYYMALFLENGLIPTREVVDQALLSKFNFLMVLDPTAIVFRSEDFTSLQKFETVS